jgi:hypothetical protein
VTAAVVPPKDAPDEADGLTLLLAAEQDYKLDPVLRVKDPLAGAEAIDTAGADHAFVVVINTLQQGESRRPGFCIGTPEEVAACKNTLVPPDPPPEPPPDAGPDEQPVPATPHPPPADEAGCNCNVVAPQIGGGLALLLPLAAVIATGSRRRRRFKRKDAEI